MSTAKSTSSGLRANRAKGGGQRRNAAGVTPAQAQAAVLAQQGRTLDEIAQEMGLASGDSGRRSVRRHLAAALKAGVAVAPQDAKPRETKGVRQDPATGRIQKPKRKSGVCRVIGVTGGGGRNAAMIVPAKERKEDRERRTGGEGRASLGKSYAPGDHDEQGRVLVHSASGLMEERHAIADHYLEHARRDALIAEARMQAPPGATAVVLEFDNGLTEVVPL